MRKMLFAVGVVGALAGAVLLLRRTVGHGPDEATDDTRSAGSQGKHQVLTGVSNLRATVARMKRDPTYRPGGYGTGKEAPKQAEAALKEAEVALEDVRSEGDA